MSSSNYDELNKKLQNLEQRLHNLEKSVAEVANKSGVIGARQVTGYFQPQKNTKLNISQIELVNIYRDSPQILEGIAIKVSLSADSYRQKTSGEIYLEKTGNGNYWVVCTQDNNYWLVPRDNIFINTPVMKTLQLMFNCEGYQDRKTKEFILTRPAKLSLSPNNKQWKLEELGELNFSRSQSKASFLETEIKQIKEERTKLASQIAEIEKFVLNNKNSPELQAIKKQIIKPENKQLNKLQQEIITKQQQQLEEAKKERQNLQSLLDKAEEERQEMRSQIKELMRLQKTAPATKDQTNSASVNWKNAQEVNLLTGHSDSVRTIALSNWQERQNIIASGSFDNTIKIWNLETGKLINTLEESSRINAIAIHPQTSLLVSGCDDNKIHIWNLDTLTSIPLAVHTNRVLAVAISKDGKTLISGSRDHTLKIWHWEQSDLELRHNITDDYGTILALEITPNNQQIICVYGDNTVRLWDLETGKLIKTLTRYSDLIWSIAISPDSKTLVCGNRDCTIQIIDLATGNIKQTLTKHTSAVWTVDISPDGNILASGSSDNNIILWDLHSGEMLKTLTGHSQDVLSVSFSADGQKLVSCSRDQKIRIWQP
ncbi:MAG: hypothetical protein AB4372_07800 [Xenococcus sp. (in: cyanobacteria)]